MINFDMDALRAVVAGTELKSFAKASVQLGRSPSALSMQIRKLENQAGRSLFRRSGRGLVPTEAGELMVEYARRIIALNDEAAAGIGALAADASVRIGLPQDFFEDIMPEVMRRFGMKRPRVHVEIRAGRNFAIEEQIRSGQLDAGLAFFRHGEEAPGKLIASLPLYWLGSSEFRCDTSSPVPLVLFDHPCLFRSAAMQALELSARRWRLALTTPSLPGIWAAVRNGQGISVRSALRVPDDLRDVGDELAMGKLPQIDVRLLKSEDLSPAATDLGQILEEVSEEQDVLRT